MNTAQAYSVIDQSSDIYFVTDQGIDNAVRLDGVYTLEQMEAIVVALKSRHRVALTDEQLDHMTNKGRSRCIHCGGNVRDSICVNCDG